MPEDWFPSDGKGRSSTRGASAAGEEDTGEAIHLEKGDKLVIPPGELVIDSRDIDEYYNPKGPGGYRPVANTVWSWYQVATERLGFFLFLFAFARRVDAAHALWVLVS